MLVVVCCAVVVARCFVLFDVSCLLCVVRCVLFAVGVRCLLFVVCIELCIARYLVLASWCVLFVVCCFI